MGSGEGVAPPRWRVQGGAAEAGHRGLEERQNVCIRYAQHSVTICMVLVTIECISGCGQGGGQFCIETMARFRLWYLMISKCIIIYGIYNKGTPPI